MSYIKTDKCKVYYEVAGFRNLDTIVFLHGWGCDGSVFNFTVQQLKKHFKCIVIDFPPFRKSGKLDEPLFIYDYANMVLEVLCKENVKNYSIVCHSFGCRVALELCNMDKRIDRLVITGGAGIRQRSAFTMLKIALYKMKKLLYRLHLVSEKKLLSSGSYDYKNIEDQNLRRTFVNVVNYNQKHLLKNIKCKTLLLWGDKDKQTPVKMAKIFKRKIKNSELYIFKGAGHFAFLEYGQNFVCAIQLFLKEKEH